MMAQFDINILLMRGEILNEVELERASIADRKLRLLGDDIPELKTKRKKLRDLIYDYEQKNWTLDAEISDQKVEESDRAEAIVESERIFIEKRKQKILSELKKRGLNQQEFGILLGHNSKSYISELMNGIVPFSLKDLVLIHRLFKINLSTLIPTFLPDSERKKLENSLQKLNKPKVKLNDKDFSLV